MKKTLFINGYIYIPGENAIKRTFYLFEMMRERGMDVTFLTSDFNHYTKQKRDVNKFYSEYPEYKNCIKFLDMHPYKKNISFSRYLSGNAFENAAVEWFKNNGKEYDVVYVSLPASIIARKIKKYCDLYGCKLIIDVNDLWPDSLRLFLKNVTVYRALTYFIRKNVNKGYANADGIVAVSNEYLEIANKVNRNATEKLSVYIGAMLDKFDLGVESYGTEIIKDEEEFWIGYIGTLGRSYDIETVIKAVDFLKKENGINIRFKIMGQGPAEEELKRLVGKLGATNIDFLGFMDYSKMAAYLSKCNATVNCIKANASQSIINKVSDYFASGKPVLNCGPCKEMAALISDYSSGINYEAENVESLCGAINKLLTDSDFVERSGINARNLAEKLFDRKKTHEQIIEMIERI